MSKIKQEIVQTTVWKFSKIQIDSSLVNSLDTLLNVENILLIQWVFFEFLLELIPHVISPEKYCYKLFNITEKYYQIIIIYANINKYYICISNNMSEKRALYTSLPQ